jgi:hypothetical protein
MRAFTAVLRVKVTTGRVTTAVGRDRVLMDMVHCVLLAQTFTSYGYERLTEVTPRLKGTIDVESE